MDNNLIGLISPKSTLFFKNTTNKNILDSLSIFKGHERYWSGLGTALPTLAALTSNLYDVEIIDENVENINFNKKYKLIAVTAMTHQAIRAYQITSEFKKKGIHTVLGGIHPSIMVTEAKKYADTIVIGEGETIWPELLSDFKNGKIKQIYNSIDYSPVDLTKIPTPRYDLLKNKNYKIIWINTTRGCPYDCEFCSVNDYFGRKIRHKTVEQVVQEIKLIKNVLKNTYIGFSDDNLFIDKKYSFELVNELKKLNIRWAVQSDITIGNDKKLLKLLFESGCHTLFIGFESLNIKTLDNIYKKGKKLKKDYLPKFESLINNIQSFGIGILGSFIIGFDYDTVNTFDEIVNFIFKTKMLTAMIHILTPLPGTRLRERLIKENRIIPTSWDNYTFRDINFIPKYLTYEEMNNGIIEAYKKIHSESRLKDIANYFKDIFKKIRY